MPQAPATTDHQRYLDRLWRVAVHEAGHAAVAISLGLRATGVHIEPWAAAAGRTYIPRLPDADLAVQLCVARAGDVAEILDGGPRATRYLTSGTDRARSVDLVYRILHGKVDLEQLDALAAAADGPIEELLREPDVWAVVVRLADALFAGALQMGFGSLWSSEIRELTSGLGGPPFVLSSHRPEWVRRNVLRSLGRGGGVTPFAATAAQGVA